MSEVIIAKCGLSCTDCGAYQATIADDDELRKMTAEEWSKMYGGSIAPESINCLGCQEKDETKVFGHCTVCGIRTCAKEKGYTTCADCPDFGCDKVAELWKHASFAKTNLEALRA
ncbi:MAG: DUF3795 domain-containing protein [Spirochaetales bacterium]|nr:DUF3795 domain-containing protein [Spirochaetales bacterium]